MYFSRPAPVRMLATSVCCCVVIFFNCDVGVRSMKFEDIPICSDLSLAVSMPKPIAVLYTGVVGSFHKSDG